MITNNIDYKKQFENFNSWGIHACLDISKCDPLKIRSKRTIHSFVVELCDLIQMKRFGNPIIEHFGEDERVSGYSLVQLIETSLISGHFANQTNSIYIDIFSCKYFDPYEVMEFTKNYFDGKECKPHILLRK